MWSVKALRNSLYLLEFLLKKQKHNKSLANYCFCLSYFTAYFMKNEPTKLSAINFSGNFHIFRRDASQFTCSAEQQQPNRYWRAHRSNGCSTVAQSATGYRQLKFKPENLQCISLFEPAEAPVLARMITPCKAIDLFLFQTTSGSMLTTFRGLIHWTCQHHLEPTNDGGMSNSGEGFELPTLCRKCNVGEAPQTPHQQNLTMNYSLQVSQWRQI